MASKKKRYEAFFIPAGLFIGMGIGFITLNFPAWLFIGLGVGFLLTALSRLIKK